MDELSSYKINKYISESEIPEITKECFNKLKDRWGFSMRITDFPEHLKVITDMEFDGMDLRQDWTPQFVSYIIDLQRDYMSGADIDMVVFHQDIIKVFHMTKLERQYLVEKEIEKRLWSVFLAVCNPSHKKFELNND